MKNFIIISSFLYAISLFAQESHSPQYKCVHSTEDNVIYLLVGNSFLREGAVKSPNSDNESENTQKQTGPTDEIIADLMRAPLDFSDEVIMSTSEEYFAGVKRDSHKYIFQVKPSQDGFLTEAKEFTKADGLPVRSMLLLNESYELIHTENLLTDECLSEPTLEICNSRIVYNCMQQSHVDRDL